MKSMKKSWSVLTASTLAAAALTVIPATTESALPQAAAQDVTSADFTVTPKAPSIDVPQCGSATVPLTFADEGTISYGTITTPNEDISASVKDDVITITASEAATLGKAGSVFVPVRNAEEGQKDVVEIVNIYVNVTEGDCPVEEEPQPVNTAEAFKVTPIKTEEDIAAGGFVVNKCEPREVELQVERTIDGKVVFNHEGDEISGTYNKDALDVSVSEEGIVTIVASEDAEPGDAGYILVPARNFRGDDESVRLARIDVKISDEECETPAEPEPGEVVENEYDPKPVYGPGAEPTDPASCTELQYITLPNGEKWTVGDDRDFVNGYVDPETEDSVLYFFETTEDAIIVTAPYFGEDAKWEFPLFDADAECPAPEDDDKNPDQDPIKDPSKGDDQDSKNPGQDDSKKPSILDKLKDLFGDLFGGDNGSSEKGDDSKAPEQQEQQDDAPVKDDEGSKDDETSDDKGTEDEGSQDDEGSKDDEESSEDEGSKVPAPSEGGSDDQSEGKGDDAKSESDAKKVDKVEKSASRGTNLANTGVSGTTTAIAIGLLLTVAGAAFIALRRRES